MFKCFDFFSEFCEKISLNSSRLFKRDSFIEYCRNIDLEKGKKSIYLLLGSVSSFTDNSIFNFSEVSIEKAIIEYTEISIEELRNKMLRFGDLGSVIYQILIEKNLNNSDLLKKNEFNNVWNLIEKLTKINGKNSQKLKIEILKELFKSSSPISCKYIVRIIQGELRIGLSDKTILDACSILTDNKIKYKDLEKIYALQSDLGLIFEKCLNYDFEYFNNEIKPILGIAIQPEAADRIETIEKLFDYMDKPLLVQPKYDGFRLQAHFSNNNISLFSRNLINVNEMFPEIVSELKRLNEEKIFENIILDGEMLVYDLKNNIYSSFQETASRKRKNQIDDISKTHPIHYVLFDIIYLNDKSLLNEKYIDRLEVLNKLFSNLNNPTIKVTKTYNVYESSELIDINKFYVKNDYEGIMVKNPISIYEAGKRSKNWIKIKKIQESSLGDMIDVVIVGYYYGKGKRVEQKIGSLIVAIYDNEKEEYLTIAKIGTGMSVDIWKELSVECEKVIISENLNNVKYSKIHLPDVYCYPKIVLSVRADTITKSIEHTSGYSLRFPRLINIVKDKNSNQITNLKEIDFLFKNKKEEAF